MPNDTVSLDVEMMLTATGDMLARSPGPALNDGREGSSARPLAATDDESVCETFFACGWFTAQQFRIVFGLAESAAHARMLIPVVVDRAVAYGTAPAAVGAAAALVDPLVRGDADDVLDRIDAARSALGDVELTAGIVAFCASLTEQIADLSGLDPAFVLGELGSSVGAVDTSIVRAVRRSRRRSGEECSRRHASCGGSLES